MNRETYRKAGLEHTNKDKVIDREESEENQKILNGHVSMLLKAMRVGEDWEHQSRIRSTTLNDTAAVPPMYPLIKDHKKPGEGGIPRTRPVVAGNKGMNLHLNELLSDILEPIVALAKENYEAISTEDSLRSIDDMNQVLRERGQDREGRGEGHNTWPGPKIRGWDRSPPKRPTLRVCRNHQAPRA